jgi:hypothetical protein
MGSAEFLPHRLGREHGLAYARSIQFYNKTLFWQWMRLPGDNVFAVAAVHKRLRFTEANGNKIGLTNAQRVLMWLHDMERSFAPVASWLP